MAASRFFESQSNAAPKALGFELSDTWLTSSMSKVRSVFRLEQPDKQGTHVHLEKVFRVWTAVNMVEGLGSGRLSA